MPLMVLESLPLCGDLDSTLVQSNPEDWVNTSFMMDLLSREGAPVASSSASSSHTPPSAIGQEPPQPCQSPQPCRSKDVETPLPAQAENKDPPKQEENCVCEEKQARIVVLGAAHCSYMFLLCICNVPGKLRSHPMCNV